MFKKIYCGFAAFIVTGYFVSALLGWEFGGTKQDRLDDSARSSDTGYRSHTFWHTTYYHGGK